MKPSAPAYRFGSIVLGRRSPFEKRVVGISRVLPDQPNRRRDLVELRLECGHHYPLPQLKRRRAPLPYAPADELLGMTFVCRKCMVVERLRAKTSGRRRRPHGLRNAR